MEVGIWRKAPQQHMHKHRGSSGQQLYRVGPQSGREEDIGGETRLEMKQRRWPEGLACCTKYRFRPLNQRRQTH